MDETPDIAAFEEKILADAGKETSAILQKAREKREEKLAAVRSQASLARRALLNQAQAEAEAERNRLLTEATGKVRNLFLLARESAVEEAFRKTRELAGAFRNDPVYPEILLRLIGEAADAVRRPEMDVVLSPRDLAALGAGFDRRIEERLLSRYALRAAIALKTGGPDEPGATVRSRDGRVSYDNTFSARWKRLAPRLRQVAYQEIFGGAAPAEK
jgi:V/A-type H+-transporting ATPase subunit E